MRRRWTREFTARERKRLIRRVSLSFAWLTLSVVIQMGALTLIWELWLYRPPPGAAPRTGFFAGMQGSRKVTLPPPQIPEEFEPELEPPEEPEPIEVDPLEAPDEPAERREKLVEFAAPEWEPDQADEAALIGFHKVTDMGGGPADGGGHHALRTTRRPGLTENAVGLGLKWLADHQDVDEDGKWDCDGFMKHDPFDDQCDGAGGPLYDVGVTGLALMAFLGAGYTDRGSRDSRYVRSVRMGLRYLMKSQADGTFGTRAARKFIYNHAIATVAMCEAQWRTRNPRYTRSAQRALDFVAMARNPYMAWRYEPRGGENDTAVTTWCVLALQAGRRAGLDVDPDGFEGARQWINKITDPTFGQVGYNYPGGAPARPEGLKDKFPPEKSQSMTAAGILCRLTFGEDPRTSEMIKKGANLCAELSPSWNPDSGSIDMYYWYFGTRALRGVGGRHWSKWNESLQEALVKNQHQRGSGSRTGSWDPIGVRGGEGGRIYSTALLTMCLGTVPPPR
ncbi:MAG: hypothetical protein ACYTDU_05600 [Planctomycetota bacterium]|jgi:hypothetical protein